MKKAVFLALLASLASFSVTGCGNSGDGGSKGPISAIVAKESNAKMKLGERITVSDYYEIKSGSALKPSQMLCKVTSSDPSIVKISNRSAEAVGIGTATLTVVSQLDETKSCTFDITVTDVFIDRSLTYIPSEDDFEDEYDSETGTGSFTTHSMVHSNFYYVKGINDLKWYLESDITFNAVNPEDRWPKIGIVARSFNSLGQETMATFFLSANIGLYDTVDEEGNIVKGYDNKLWRDFGVCEVDQNGHWAWEEGTTNAFARHNDSAWQSTRNLTFGTPGTFNLGVARDGTDFHVYIDHRYVGSYQLSPTLEILWEDGAPLPSHVGFWHFNSDVTFANYRVSKEESDVAAKIPASPIFTEFQED